MVELQCADLVDDLRDDLDGTGPGAHDRDPLAGEVDTVIPLRGVERLPPFEVGQALDIGGDGWDVQRTGPPGYEELRDVFAAVFGEDVPAILGVVPVGAFDARAEMDVAAQTVLVGHTPLR